MPEGKVKVEPKATHEVKVIRANGDEEVVSQRILSLEESKTLLERMRQEAPEMVAEAERKAIEKKEREQNG
jgi:hypothetical protein